MKIYDCFLFFNEIELLELRLELLYPHVDYFVISECDYTFSGLEKPFFFEQNKEKFSKYSDKIIHLKINNSKETNSFTNTFQGKQKEIFNLITNSFINLKTDWKHQQHWCLEYLHREYVKLGIIDCNDDDLIIFSDLDEIPNPKIFSKDFPKLDFNNLYVLVGNSYSYYLNVLTQTNWYGAFVTKYKNITTNSLNTLRVDREKFISIPDSTWHFTNMGGEERVITKIKSWGHQEYNYPYMLSTVKQKMENLTDLFGRSNMFYKNGDKEFYFEKMKKLDVMNHFPQELITIVQKNFPHFIKQ